MMAQNEGENMRNEMHKTLAEALKRTSAHGLEVRLCSRLLWKAPTPRNTERRASVGFLATARLRRRMDFVKSSLLQPLDVRLARRVR